MLKYIKILPLIALAGCATIKPYADASLVGIATATGGTNAGILTLSSLFAFQHPYLTSGLVIVAIAFYLFYLYKKNEPSRK